MRQVNKQILSMLLIFLLIFQSVPTLYADPSSSSSWTTAGTTDDPHVIATAEELYEIRNYSSDHFILGNDINLDVPPYNTGEGWEPIEWLNGTLDGKGYRITGLYINRPSAENVGLFGSTSDNAEISNIRLVNVNVTGNYVVGGMVGYNRGSVNNLYVSGNVSGAEAEYESDTIGGLVGINEGDISNSVSSSEVTGHYLVGGLSGDNSGFISDSYATGNVFGIEYVGGLTGWVFSNGSITNSHATGNVTGNDIVGGLVGQNSDLISFSYASGEVAGESNVGGLVGYNHNTISNSYAYGKVTGVDRVGGLVGGNYTSSTSGISINYSYSSGEVNGDSQTGGLVGYNLGEVQNSFWDIEASGQEQSAAGEGKSTSQLQQPASFGGDWDFHSVWMIGDGESYPKLRWQLNSIPLPWEGEGGGTQNHPFIITSADEFNHVRNYENAYFELGGDIDLSDDYGAEDGWEPIGSASSPFVGIIDGKGYKIKGLYINRSTQDDIGLFGVTGNGFEISNVRIENMIITGQSNVGGLVGTNGGVINNVYVGGVITGTDSLGGLVGVNAGNINESYSSSHVGGIEYLGGLVGVNEGNISNSYAKGDVVATNDYAGGLVGSNQGGNIIYSYASGEVTSVGEAGGLVGENTHGNVNASYWDNETTSQTTSAESSNEFGKLTIDMCQQATYVDWDFDHIWAIDEGESYPYFKADYEGAGLPWKGSGTEEDPYIIKTASHLNQMREHLNEVEDWFPQFALGADINLDVLPFNTGEGWEPVGTISVPFNSKLDGKGFNIKGLYINRSRGDFVGLIGYTGYQSNITHLKLVDVDVTSADYDRVGGLAGYNNGSISYISLSGRVEANTNSGGLVGYNSGQISYAYASGEMIGSDFIGGLVGANEGSILQSFATNQVNGVDFLGGLVGVSDGTISDSFATGDVIAENGYTGGLVGANDGIISNSYAIGEVVGMGYIGGLASEVNGGHSAKSYWDKETTKVNYSAGSHASYGKLTAEMKQQATYVDWDFDSIWEIEEGESYPTLRWLKEANLSDLTISEGTLSPAFTSEAINYTARVNRAVDEVELTAASSSGGTIIEVNGERTISGVATTIPLKLGRNSIDVVVKAFDDVTTKRYTLDITRATGASSPSTKVIQVPVETGQIGSATTVMETTITRITEPSGTTRDEIILTPDRAKETAQRIAEAGQTTARIMIPDVDDEVSQVDVSIPGGAISELVSKNVSLEIFTDNVSIRIPQRSMDAVKDDLFFRVIPLKDPSQRQEVEQRAKIELVVKEAAIDDKVNVVSRPMTIETNMPNQPVTLVLPLRDVNLPIDEQERATFLNELMVFIEHSDGERRLIKGKIVEYKDGLLGIEFDVNKFSTFTILHMEGIGDKFHEAYVRGYMDGTFRPNAAVTRAEIAVMLAKNSGFSHGSQAAITHFADVLPTHWAVGAIQYVNQQGLMKGATTGEFNPNIAITRAEMAAIIARHKSLIVSTEEESRTAFTDIAGHWALLQIAANKQEGILNGYEDGTFRPNGNLTRAEAVRVFNRMFDRGPLYEVSTRTFHDVRETHWAFHEVEEAVRDHFFTQRLNGGENIVK